MKFYKVLSLRTGKETVKNEEQVNALKASPLFKAGNFQITELKSAEAPVEAVQAIKAKSETPGSGKSNQD